MYLCLTVKCHQRASRDIQNFQNVPLVGEEHHKRTPPSYPALNNLDPLYYCMDPPPPPFKKALD